METEEINNVVQETAQENSTEAELGAESAPTDNPESQEAPQEDLQARNIREMRLRKEQAERERDDARRQLEEIQRMQQPKQEVVQQIEEEIEDLKLAEDEFVEGKHLSKVAKKIKKLENQLKNYQQATTTATVETRLKQKYNDFDSVVSKENVEALVRDYPELGATLKANSDLYSQAVSAYTMIKQMGIYREDKFAGDRAKAEQNAAKPRPLASVSPQEGQGPLTKANAFANGLTDELKEQLRREMKEARARM